MLYVMIPSQLLKDHRSGQVTYQGTFMGLSPVCGDYEYCNVCIDLGNIVVDLGNGIVECSQID
jgi:hypothetical protein